MCTFKGYITDEPQFACSHVNPPNNSNVEWAALVYYSSMSCDCSYEQKVSISMLIDCAMHNTSSNTYIRRKS